MSDIPLAAHLNENLIWTVNLLDNWIDRSNYVMGGGSVLEARWHHRHSTDIDLFIHREAMSIIDLSEILKNVKSMERDGDVTEVNAFPHGFHCTTPFGPMSLFGTNREMSVTLSDEKEPLTGIAYESTTEILFRKLRNRMSNFSRYLPRDMYDLMVSYILDKPALDAAFNQLLPDEIESLAEDMARGIAKVQDLGDLVNPSFEELVRSADEFNVYIEAVLTRNVPRLMQRYLEKMRKGRT